MDKFTVHSVRVNGIQETSSFKILFMKNVIYSIKMRRFCARPQMEMQLKLPVGVTFFFFFNFEIFFKIIIKFMYFKFTVTVKDQNLVSKWYNLMISGQIGNWPIYKLQSSQCHTFQYRNGQMILTSLRILQFQTFIHHTIINGKTYTFNKHFNKQVYNKSSILAMCTKEFHFDSMDHKSVLVFNLPVFLVQ